MILLLFARASMVPARSCGAPCAVAGMRRLARGGGTTTPANAAKDPKRQRREVLVRRRGVQGGRGQLEGSDRRIRGGRKGRLERGQLRLGGRRSATPTRSRAASLPRPSTWPAWSPTAAASATRRSKPTTRRSRSTPSCAAHASASAWITSSKGVRPGLRSLRAGRARRPAVHRGLRQPRDDAVARSGAGTKRR